MIPAGPDDLRKAFQKHSDAGKACACSSHYLLLFYAAECGLKSIYLRRNKLVRLTNEMHRTDSNYPPNGHDLMGLIKALKLPAGEHLSPPIDFRHSTPSPQINQGSDSSLTQAGSHASDLKVFVGSIKSNKYHYPSCQWALKIKPENEI